MAIEIPLSKQGKHQGKYFAIADDGDDFLLCLNFRVSIQKTTKTQYAVTGDEGTAISMHRMVMECILERPLKKGEMVDHIDRNGLNNQRSNLRLTDKSKNGMNRGAQANSKSGIKGIRWHEKRQRWIAQICKEGIRYHLGYFKLLDDAIKARKEKEKELFGEYNPR